MLNLIYNNKKKFKLPQSWSEVSFKTYLKYLEIYENGLDKAELYALFSGLDVSYWLNKHSPKVFMRMDRELSFISTLPETEKPTHLAREIDGKKQYFEVESNFLNLEMGKYQDILAVINELDRDNEKQSYQLSIFPKMIAVLVGDYKTEEQLEEIAKEIELMPCNIVYTLGSFFLSKSIGLKSGIKKKLSIKGKILQSCKAVLTRSLATLVIFIACIFSPMVTLRSIIKYLKKLLVRFTGGNNYKVEYLNPKRYTLI